MQASRELAERTKICIAKEDSRGPQTGPGPERGVVVCLCQGMTVRGLLAMTFHLNLTGRFILLGR
ncbi:Metabotropic glutamate receptor 1 [Homalodisca vitripennis]|nr:Metabotropic glutamate receptor 1 [Homalodisca vitripennis]